MGCIPLKKSPAEEKIKSNFKKFERKNKADTSIIMNDLEVISEQYTFKGLLGYGKDGRVLLAESTETGQQVAIKVISKSNMSRYQLTEEVENLSKVDHPNIVKYFKHYEAEDYFYVIMEYCAGGDLFRKITDCNKFTEVEAAAILEKLLRAINHCHHLGIIHRDLKPENIMYSSEGFLKIIDFGLSMKAGAESKEQLAGTPCYIAPEIIVSEHFSKACDIWSLGIILHVLLTGYTPINGNTAEEICRKTEMYRGPEFHSTTWKSISEEAKDLLKKMLDPDPDTRITAAEALKHPWIRSEKKDTTCNRTIINALRRYSEFSGLKKTILLYLVKNISDKEAMEFQETFLELDKEKIGLITINILEEALRRSDDEIVQEELQQLINKINPNEPYINYSTFIAALIATTDFLTEKKLKLLHRLIEIEPQKYLINENPLIPVKRDALTTDSSEAMQQDGMKLNMSFERLKDILIS